MPHHPTHALTSLCGLALLFFAAASPLAVAAEKANPPAEKVSAPLDTAITTFLSKHCVQCHGAEKKKADEEQKKKKLPSFELQDRQTAVDLMLAPDDAHVFIVVAERD